MKKVVMFDFKGGYEVLDSFPIGTANTGQYVYQAMNKAWYINYSTPVGKYKLISFPTSVNSRDVPLEYHKIIKTLELLYPD